MPVRSMYYLPLVETQRGIFHPKSYKKIRTKSRTGRDVHSLNSEQ